MATTGGAEEVTLTVQQIPSHSHALLASTSTANNSAPNNNVLAQSTAADLYIEDTAITNLSANAITGLGGSQPHTNLQPFLCVSYIISLFGIFPSPT